jgi:hypothetical protein
MSDSPVGLTLNSWVLSAPNFDNVLSPPVKLIFRFDIGAEPSLVTSTITPRENGRKQQAPNPNPTKAIAKARISFAQQRCLTISSIINIGKLHSPKEESAKDHFAADNKGGRNHYSPALTAVNSNNGS